MKLKKIASLALAGIMAVSMLAGCKDGGNSNSGSSSSDNTNPTAGLSAQFGSYLSNADADYITFEDSNTYQSVLQSYIKASVTDSTVHGYRSKAATVVGNTGAGNVVKTYMDRVVDDFGNWNFDAITNTTVTINTVDGVYANVYAADGQIAQDVVLNQIANLLDTKFNKTNLKETIADNGKVADFEYVCSVSMEKVEASDGLDSAWYVMIVLDVDATSRNVSNA